MHARYARTWLSCIAAVALCLAGLSCGGSTTPEFPDPPSAVASATTSTIGASPEQLEADGASTSTVTVQLKDADGTVLTGGGDAVTLDATLGGVGPVTDELNGTYTAQFTAGTTDGDATITGSVNGVTMANTATIVLMTPRAFWEAGRNGTVVWGTGPDNYYIAAGQEVFRFARDTEIDRGIYPGTGVITDMWIDERDGSLWVVSDRGAIMKFDPDCAGGISSGACWSFSAGGGAFDYDAVFGDEDLVYAVGFAGFGCTGGEPAGPNVGIIEKPFSVRDHCVEDLFFHGIWISPGAGDCCGFAVGDRLMERFDGVTWSPDLTFPLSGPFSLNAVYGTGPNNVVTVGDDGVIVHFDGANWTVRASGTVVNLNDVWGLSADNMFAVGDGGTILHFDGDNWSPMDSGVGGNLNSIWGFSADYIRIVGQSGLVHDRLP